MDAVLKGRCQTVSKLILQLWLLGLFLHIFGLPALERYLKKKVIMVRSVEKAESIPIPAITIAVNGAKSRNGWKKQGAVQNIATKICKYAKTTDALVACIESHTYNFSEPGFPRVQTEVFSEQLPYYYPIALTEVVELPDMPED